MLDPDDEVSADVDIKQIVKTCLKEVRKLKTVKSIKMVTLLTAVSEYVKLRDRFEKHPKCKRPCLNASLAIARRMGKGPYFARQTRRNEVYLLKHKHLPPTKSGAQNGQYTLLDNETVLHGVRRYLAAQGLGSNTHFSFVVM